MLSCRADAGADEHRRYRGSTYFQVQERKRISSSGAGAPQNHAAMLVTKQLPTPSRRAADMATNPQGCRPATYACRPPEQTVLYRLVQPHLASYLALACGGDGEGHAAMQSANSDAISGAPSWPTASTVHVARSAAMMSSRPLLQEPRLPVVQDPARGDNRRAFRRSTAARPTPSWRKPIVPRAPQSGAGFATSGLRRSHSDFATPLREWLDGVANARLALLVERCRL
jgi:hypothetical protein